MTLLLALFKAHKVESQSIDFVLAFPQAVSHTEVCKETPCGFLMHHDGQSYVLKLKILTCGIKKSNFNFTRN